MQAQAFLDRYREEVLAFARRPLRELLGSHEVCQFIARIEADEATSSLMPPRRDMVRSEDAFWFCVMQLDEFGAIDWPGAIHEPFLHHLHHDLKRAAYCLSHHRDLPAGMTVQWMDEDDADDWEAAEIEPEKSRAEPRSLDQLFTVRQMDPKDPRKLMISIPLCSLTGADAPGLPVHSPRGHGPKSQKSRKVH